MSVPHALAAGFALAATIARDSGAKLAHIGLAPDVRDAWCGLARDLERCSKAERRERVRELIQLRRPRALPRGLSPRALELLRAPQAPRRVREGYAPEPALVALLTRITQRAAGR